MEDGDGNVNDLNQNSGELGWRAQLKDDLKTHEAFTKYQTVSDLGKAYLELDGKVQNSIPKLSEKATDEEKAAYYKAIGRPDKPEEYDIQIPEGLPDDKATVDWFRATVHELGMPKTMAEAFVSKHMERLVKQKENLDKSGEKFAQDAENKLKDEWKGDTYTANLEIAKSAAKKVGGDEYMDFLDEKRIIVTPEGARVMRLGDDPIHIKAWHKVGTAISEAAFHPGGAQPSPEIQRTPGGEPVLKFPSMEK